MEDDFLDKLSTYINSQINLASENFRDEIVSLKAEKSILKFLLEILYAELFKNNPESLDGIELASISAQQKKPQGMSEDEAKMLITFNNLHLERFFESVRERIRHLT